MTNAATQKTRRAKHAKLRRCAWCKKFAWKNGKLCHRHMIEHRASNRKQYLKRRNPAARQYACKKCGEYGHNQRRHKT